MKKFISVLLVLAMVVSMAACGASAPAVPETNDSEMVIFTDDTGREVEVPAEISKIVPTGPLAQIMLYAIAPDMLVGLAAKWGEGAKGIVPEEYLNLPYFGQLYNTANLNVEELAMVGPQVIIDIGQGMPKGTEDMETLQQQTNIPTVYISSSLDTMPDTFRTLGKLLGREEKAEELAKFCEEIFSRTTSIMEQVGDNKVNALCVLGELGLNVLAKDSFQSELVDMLTNNIAVVENPSGKGSGNEVTMEQIAVWNPDYVLFAADSIYDTVDTMDAWADITAIADGNYMKVPDGPHNWMGSPPAAQRYLGMIWVTAQLYPEYCDYDAKADVMKFYELFYDCQLTEEQFNNLTKDAYIVK